MSTQATQERILAAAERLFADQGLAATSMRSITAAAKVNLAAVHYHFGSKEALVQEVFARRIRPLNEERLRLLDAHEASAGDGPVPLEAILEAFVAPSLSTARTPSERASITRLLGRTYTEPSDALRKIFAEQFGEIRDRFGAALRRTLPDLPPKDLFWRLHFAIGAMAQTMADPHRIESLSGGLCDPFDIEEATTQLVRFLTAGMNAPATKPGAGEEQ